MREDETISKGYESDRAPPISEQSYKVHSNNSPDDLSVLTQGKKLPKQLKWVLVSEGNQDVVHDDKQPKGLKGFLNSLKPLENRSIE